MFDSDTAQRKVQRQETLIDQFRSLLSPTQELEMFRFELSSVYCSVLPAYLIERVIDDEFGECWRVKDFGDIFVRLTTIRREGSLGSSSSCDRLALRCRDRFGR